jgi:DNA-binding IscR family transcriptional regulator
LLDMAQNGRFGLSVRLLAKLAEAPDKLHTSATLAEALGTGPVMVRRLFPALHQAGFIVQHKGPGGGAKLKVSPKAIGLGDVMQASESGRVHTGEKAVDGVLKRVHADAVRAMNETSIASVVKKMKKG